jgi:hypothetical protein
MIQTEVSFQPHQFYIQELHKIQLGNPNKLNNDCEISIIVNV